MCELILDNFEDPINQILLAAAIVSIIIGFIKDGFPNGLIDGISIFVALFIISAVNSVNNIVSEKKLRDLICISKH
jgi:magnesium-transporting ATPase (P-type)